jgi:hypothetical protein
MGHDGARMAWVMPTRPAADGHFERGGRLVSTPAGHAHLMPSAVNVRPGRRLVPGRGAQRSEPPLMHLHDSMADLHRYCPTFPHIGGLWSRRGMTAFRNADVLSAVTYFACLIGCSMCEAPRPAARSRAQHGVPVTGGGGCPGAATGPCDTRSRHDRDGRSRGLDAARPALALRWLEKRFGLLPECSKGLRA